MGPGGQWWGVGSPEGAGEWRASFLWRQGCREGPCNKSEEEGRCRGGGRVRGGAGWTVKVGARSPSAAEATSTSQCARGGLRAALAPEPPLR